MTPTTRDWKRLERRVAVIATLLGFDAARIGVSRQPPDEENQAELHRDGVYALIRFGSDFWLATPTMRTQIIAHELAHLWTSQLRDAMRHATDALGVAGYPMRQTLEDLEDAAVDAIAAAFVPLLPPED